MSKTIDAKGKTLGRVATEAASLLMGKDKTSFVRNKISGESVLIINASQIKIDPKKMKEKFYLNYSGYPGGLKKEDMKKVVGKKGFAEIFKLAIDGMLPKNRLHDKMMKNLKVTE